MRRIGLVLLTLLAMVAFGTGAWAADEHPQLRNGNRPQITPLIQKVAPAQETRMTGHMETVPAELYGQNGPWVAPRTEGTPLDTEPEVWVDDDYDGSEIGYGVTLFNTIQAGIDGVDAGGTVNVYPGAYAETATGRFVLAPSGQGPHQFGLFVDHFHNGITIQGVDAGGLPITSYAGVLAIVSLHATNSFGASGMFIEGDDVTVTGLELYQIINHNKSIEVIGDNLTFKWNKITDGNSLYFNDWRFDVGLDISWVQSYTIDSNLFDVGTSIDIASGAGYTGLVSGRQIINNDFEMDWPALVDYWAAISFNGSGSGVPWFVQSVGAAEITGNTFNYAEGFYIRHRGTFTNPADFDWVSYWDDNSFDKKVAFGTNPPSVMGTYSYPNSYGTFTDVKEIGANIQREIDWAAPGNTVLCGPGTYSEWDILVDKAITLQGAGVTSIIDATGHIPTGEETVLRISAPTGNVTVDGFKIQTGQNDAIWSTGNMNASSVVTISNNELEGFDANDDPAPGVNFGLIAGYGQLAKVVFDNNVAHDFYSNVILCENQVGQTEVTNNTLSASFGIFYMTHDGYDVTALQKISENSFNLGGLVPGWNSAGIAFESAYHTVGRTGKFGNVEITDNSLTGMVADRRGISLYNASLGAGTDGEITSPVVKRNTVSGGGANTRGIQLIGLVSNADIQNNAISGMEFGVRGFTGAFGETALPTGTILSRNSITGSSIYAVRWQGVADFNASGNWWGAAPVWASILSGPVDYTPWCQLDGTYDNPGFTPNMSQLMVEAGSPQTGLVNRVQEGIDLTLGSTVNLSAGTFVGQVVMSALADIHLIGAGVGSTFIHAPATLPHFFSTGPNNYAVLSVENCTVAEIKDLTVDGLGLGNANYRFMGIAYYNSGGSIENVDVTAIRETPLNGSQHGVGVWAFNTLASNTLDLTNVSVDDCQKNSFVLAGNLVVDALDVTAVGAGPTTLIAQNGIQVSGGASGTFNNCDVTGFEYTPYSVTSTGYLIFGPTTVAITGADVVDCQSGVVAYAADVSFDSGSINYVSAVTAPYGIYEWKFTALASARRVPLSPVEEPDVVNRHGGRSLDTPNAFSVTNSTITGNGLTGSVGIAVFGDAGDVSADVDNNDVTMWEQGIYLDVNGGTISSADVTDNTFTNDFNTYDDTPGHNWDSNCYSDFSANAGYPTTYEIPGASPVNVDYNPNPNGCSDVNFVVTDNLIGCNATCNTTLLYITLDVAGLPNLELVFTLPAGFSTTGGTVTPGANADPNLLSAYASVSGQVVTLDMGFNTNAGGSTGDNTLYVACFTLTSTAATGTHTVAGNSSLWIDGLGGNHVNELILGSIDIEVDCTPPAAPTTFEDNGTCAYGSGYMPADVFSVTGLTAGGGAALQTVWVTFNGNVSPTFPITLVGADPYSFTFPAAGSEATFYGYLDALEGCNTLNLHVTDAECNTGTFNLPNVGWDGTDPAPIVSYTQSACYNNTPGDPQYGATLLVGDLEIDLAAAVACEAATFDLTLTILAETVNAYDDVVSISDYPSVGEATTLWNAIVTAVGVNYTGSVTVNWTAADCAGNSISNSFEITCLDFVPPGNTVTTFDARPADAGVWLNWAWTPDAGQAVEMHIYRSPITPNTPPAGYPGYDPALRDVYNVGSVPPAGWTLVETQSIAGGEFTSAAETDDNNRSDFYQHLTYWLDADAGWYYGGYYPDGFSSGPDALGWRDIYRYVTFVKDAGGNWSTGYVTTPGTNVDHSTNYWLGDFAPADNAGFNNSRGKVDIDDLSLLSAVYFTSVPNDYRNIGPVIVENGNIGKGIPNPETGGAINFQDLVPFSFNYSMVGRYGNPLEFVVEPDPSVIRPFNRLDETPVVSLATETDPALEVGSEFTVTVSLTGNEGRTVKAVEARLNYDDAVLEVVGTTAGNPATAEGTLFAKVSAVAGEAGQIGLVAASCGGWATLDGNATLGMVTFRIKTGMTSACNIELTSISMFDNAGEIVEIDGETITLFGAQAVPNNYALYQNYPNPFNPSTNIQFDLKESGHVTILVFNTLGQMVAKVVDNDMEAGRHNVSFDASSMASGLYVYSISVNGFSDLKKMVLIR